MQLKKKVNILTRKVLSRLRGHFYPVDIPPIEIRSGLDFLLLELPPRYQPMMPNGLAYVQESLKQCGVEYQTIDLSIILYHRYHQARLLKKRVHKRPGGDPMPENPWENTMISDWHGNDFIEFFKPDLTEALDAIEKASPKMVGISLNGFNRKLAKGFVEELRNRLPDVIIVVGGYDCVYPNVGPTLFSHFDYMIVAESEGSLPLLLKTLMRGEKARNLPGVISKYDDPAVPFTPAPLVQDLDAIDFPRYEWISHELYQTYLRQHLIPITASRGCNWGRCRFCAECFQFRKRSPVNVVDEIAHWVGKGYHTFHFNESDVNGDPKNLYDICSEIIARDLTVQMVGQLRVHRENTAEYFEHLSKAGFKHLRFGVDGWSGHVLKLQCKGYTIERALQNVRDCSKAGIHTTVNVVIGVPGETEQDVDESIANISSVKEYVHAVESLNTLILACGSEYTKNPDKYKIRFRGDMDAIYDEHPYFIPTELWYSEEPYIDQSVRMDRLEKICRELHANGVNIGAFAEGIVKELKDKQAS